jgi:hypothetical protein
MAAETYKTMREKWGFERAPLNPDGIARPTDPFSREACDVDVGDFEEKFILGGIVGRLTFGYLWSAALDGLPPEATGTGYGKTSLMRFCERRINQDWGRELLSRFSSTLNPAPRIVAAYTKLDNEDTRGLFSLLFSAVERWADAGACPGPNGESVLGAARAAIVTRLGCADGDVSAIRQEVEQAHRNLPGAATASPPREELVAAFCSPDPDTLVETLAQETPTTRNRSGLAFFETAMSCLRAAEVEHVFLFLDQLEYMVTNRAVTRAKKTQEVARFRTVFTERSALVDRAHVIFTLHERASAQLQEFWESNRLPPFDWRNIGNQNAIIVLRGLRSPEKIRDLVKPYFDLARPPSHPMRGSSEPLDPETFERLWRDSTARPGIILRRVASALELAAREGRDRVDQHVMARVLDTPLVDAEQQAAIPAATDATSLIG